METGEHVTARLVRPPPPRASRLLRPPRRGAGRLVGSALAAARTLPLPLALLAAARLLRSAGWSMPVVVFAGALRHATPNHGDPIAAVAVTLASPGVWLPAFGFTAAAVLAAALVEIAAWALGLPPLRDRLQRGPAARPPHDRPFAWRFANLVQTALAILVLAAVWIAAALPLLAVAGRTWIAAHQAEASGGLLAAAAAALVLALVLCGGLFLRLLAEAAIARAGAFGDRPLAAVHAGAAQVLRRPGVFLVALYLLAIAAALAGFTLGLPAAFAPPGAPGFLLRVLVEVATAGAAGLLALARLGVFVAAGVDEAPTAAPAPAPAAPAPAPPRPG